MKVIVFSLDAALEDPQGPVSRRLVMYAHEGMTVHAIVPVAVPSKDTVELSPYVSVSYVKKSNKIVTFYRLLRLGMVLAQRFRADDVVVSSQDPFELGLIAFLVARRFSVGLHLQVHIDFFSVFFKQESLRNRVQALIALFLLPRANAIRVVSKKIFLYVQSLGISRERITLAPIHIDSQKLADVVSSKAFLERHKRFSLRILCASRLVKQKNIGLAIESFAQLVTIVPGAGLIVVGRGSDREHLEAVVRTHGLDGRVVFEDWTDQIFGYMKASDIFLLSSDYEGWGMTVVESSVLGTPVIMTDVGCANEFLFDGENGMVVPVRDVSMFTHKLIQLATDVDARVALGARAVVSTGLLSTREEYITSLRASWEGAVLHNVL